MQEDTSDSVEIAGQSAPDLFREFLSRPIFPDQGQAFLGSDAHHTLVEICPDKQCKIDQLLSTNSQSLQIIRELDEFWMRGLDVFLDGRYSLPVSVRYLA